MLATKKKQRIYTVQDVLTICGVPMPTLRLWLQKRLVRTSGSRSHGKLSFNLRDVHCASLVAGLRKHGVEVFQIERIVKALYDAKKLDETKPLLVASTAGVFFVETDRLPEFVGQPSVVVNVVESRAALRDYLRTYRRQKKT